MRGALLVHRSDRVGGLRLVITADSRGWPRIFMIDADFGSSRSWRLWVACCSAWSTCWRSGRCRIPGPTWLIPAPSGRSAPLASGLDPYRPVAASRRRRGAVARCRGELLPRGDAGWLRL